VVAAVKLFLNIIYGLLSIWIGVVFMYSLLEFVAQVTQ
jgi:hypothetical protein